MSTENWFKYCRSIIDADYGPRSMLNNILHQIQQVNFSQNVLQSVSCFCNLQLN